jgi:hypothetical protein
MDKAKESLRICDTCNITKSKRLFSKYKYCKRCDIKNYMKAFLVDIRIANHLNLSIDELNNIMKNIDPMSDIYDEIMLYYQEYQSKIITDEVINNFLDENFHL